MEGFTVGKANSFLQDPGGIRELKTTQIAPAPTSSPTEKGSFANTLSQAIDNVNELQVNADTQVQKLATGQTNNIPEVMMAVEKADIAMKLMMSIRNKMIDAYQEVMKMQV